MWAKCPNTRPFSYVRSPLANRCTFDCSAFTTTLGVGTAKSLELFLHDLLIKSAAVTQEKNGKSISPTHMYAFPTTCYPAASAAIHLWSRVFPDTTASSALWRPPTSISSRTS